VPAPERPQPVSAVAGDGAAVDQPGIDHPQRLIPQAQPIHDARPESFQDHAGRLGQPLENLLAFPLLEVQGQRLFVAVKDDVKPAVLP